MDEKVSLEPDKYINIAESGKLHVPPVYCIMLANDGHNLMEIISCNEFIFDYYRKKDMFVLGLSSSYKNAVTIVTSIIMQVYNETGTCDVRDYFSRERM